MTDADRPVFAAAMTKLCIALREKEPDSAQMRVYFKALEDAEIEFVVLAAENLERASQWFPKTSEWREAAKKIESERMFALTETIRKRRLSGAPPLCARCDDTGFAEGEGKRFERCECREMRRLEVLGRRPMPMLPEAVEGPKVIDIEAVSHALAATKGMR